MQLAQEMAREALAAARRSIWNLRAANLERGELRDVLAGLVTRASNETIRVNFETLGAERVEKLRNRESTRIRIEELSFRAE